MEISAKKRQALVPWLLLLPGIMLFGVMFLLPMLRLLGISFYEWSSEKGMVAAYSAGQYVRFLTDPFYLFIIVRTLRLSTIVTIAAILIGYPMAYYINEAHGKEKTYLTILTISPLLVSMVIRSLGWKITLGGEGMLNLALRALGLGPVKWMYTEMAVIVGLTHIYFPFMVLSIASGLQRVDKNLRLAAQNLGASPLRAFFTITLPLSIPGVVSGSLVVFALCTSAFVVPAVLGGPRVTTIAYMAWEQQVMIWNWPFAAAISFVLLIISSGVMLSYNKLMESGRFKGAFERTGISGQ